MKILNLYAGIGGNRKLWGDEHEVTAVEMEEEIAGQYKKNFPNDEVIIGDAHQYLLDHYKDFDFIWSSPPCPTHSKLRYCQKKKVYPEMTLWQEILFLKHWFKGKWIVENVKPYYEPLVKGGVIIGRHMFWSNFTIEPKEFESIDISRSTADELREFHGFTASRQLVRNCVDPKIGDHILCQMLIT